MKNKSVTFFDRHFRQTSNPAQLLKAISYTCLFATTTLAQPDTTTITDIAPGGKVEWIDTAQGPLKTRVYATESLSAAPILIVVLHGDIGEPPPSYQYYFAQAVTEGYDAVTVMPAPARAALGEPLAFNDIVAAGILRPGYTDPDGDRSAGEMGYGVNDNMTPEVVDAIAAAVSRFKDLYHPRVVILVGHSGGAGISANVMGRHPGLVDGALLVACGCDPDAYYASRKATEPNEPYWDLPNPSLRPLALASTVAMDARIRMVSGDQDTTAPVAWSQAYVDLLTTRGVDATIQVEPGLGHNILFRRQAFVALLALLGEFNATAGR